MASRGHRLIRSLEGEPLVEQGNLCGWFLSWNPDDGRFYVSRQDDGVASATFREWRNTTAWARSHAIAEEEIPA